jgi:hypothetical protein
MKIDIDNLEATYDSCIAKGLIKEKSVDIELIKSLKLVSEGGIEFMKRNANNIPKDSADWTFVFRGYYESLRELIEAYLLFDGIGADNHQCNNAYLCLKHPELEADWEFLETVRLKRNAVNYRGILLKYSDWLLFKIKFDLHLSLLKNKIEEKLAKI